MMSKESKKSLKKDRDIYRTLYVISRQREERLLSEYSELLRELTTEISKSSNWQKAATVFQDMARDLSLKSKDNQEKLESQRIPLLQYAHLRLCFNQLIEVILGKDYYNLGLDVYSCDEVSCSDIASRCNVDFYQSSK